MTTSNLLPCILCKHWHSENQSGFTCDAFAAGIPFDIVTGVGHDEPYEGDNGIQFEPVDDK